MSDIMEKPKILLPGWVRGRMKKKPMTAMEFKIKQREINYERLKQLYKIAKPTEEQLKKVKENYEAATKKYAELTEEATEVMNQAMLDEIKILSQGE